MTDLAMDEVTLRATVDSATDGALVLADKMVARILAEPSDVALVAWANSYVELRRLQRRAMVALRIETTG